MGGGGGWLSNAEAGTWNFKTKHENDKTDTNNIPTHYQWLYQVCVRCMIKFYYVNANPAVSR